MPQYIYKKYKVTMDGITKVISLYQKQVKFLRSEGAIIEEIKAEIIIKKLKGCI